MVSVLLRLKDAKNLERLEKYGEVVYTSKYTDIVGLKCGEKNYHLLRTLDWVSHVEEAATGKLLDNYYQV